jgi:hypothetical protein
MKFEIAKKTGKVFDAASSENNMKMELYKLEKPATFNLQNRIKHIMIRVEFIQISLRKSQKGIGTA